MVQIGLQLFKWGHFHIFSLSYNLTSDDLWPWYMTSDLNNKWGFPCRALARILKLPVILEKVPVKKVDAAGENQVEHAVAREPSRVGSMGLRAPGGVHGQCPGRGPGSRAPGSSGVSILNASGEFSWAFITNICILMMKHDTDYRQDYAGKSTKMAKLVKFMPGFEICWLF